MAKNSSIGWCDDTFNPWTGCTRVSEGCQGCYAEALLDRRFGRVKWGPAGERIRTFASIEPLTEALDPGMLRDACAVLDHLIVGGESAQPGHPARPFDLRWMETVIEIGAKTGTPVFAKQLGTICVDGRTGDRFRTRDRNGEDWSQWPANLRVRQFPEYPREAT